MLSVQCQFLNGSLRFIGCKCNKNIFKSSHINDFTTHGSSYRVFCSVPTGMPQSTRNLQTCKLAAFLTPTHAYISKVNNEKMGIVCFTPHERCIRWEETFIIHLTYIRVCGCEEGCKFASLQVWQLPFFRFILIIT